MATGTQKTDPYTGKLSTGNLPDTAATGQITADTQQGILQPTETPGTQQDINAILAPYINELTNLGPEYQQEMDFLKPYLAGTPVTFKGLEAQSAADESPTGSKSVAAASNAVSNQMENEPPPGFGEEAKAAKEYEGTVPYGQVLQSVLQAGKNQILGYSTVPNLTNINTKEWPSSIAGIIPYLEKSIGYTGSGVPNPATAAFQAGQQPGGYNPGALGQPTPISNPGTNPTPISNNSVQGGGNG